MNKNIAKGKVGENIAADFLIKRGLKIVERNWRYSRYGEIDIIAEDKGIIAFIEVKTRSSANYGYPVEAVNNVKMEKIKTLAGMYLSENPDMKFKGLRYDVIGVLLGNTPEIKYYKDVYQF